MICFGSLWETYLMKCATKSNGCIWTPKHQAHDPVWHIAPASTLVLVRVLSMQEVYSQPRIDTLPGPTFRSSTGSWPTRTNVGLPRTRPSKNSKRCARPWARAEKFKCTLFQLIYLAHQLHTNWSTQYKANLSVKTVRLDYNICQVINYLLFTSALSTLFTTLSNRPCSKDWVLRLEAVSCISTWLCKISGKDPFELFSL